MESNPQPAAPAAGDDKLNIDEKKAISIPPVENVDIETQPAEETEKTYYSKLSVWMMVLFSGLAIGSDG